MEPSRAYITHEGLKISGAIQVYSWERSIQRRFAQHAARNALTLVNVGYGLGFAQQIFEALPGVPLHLIEVNPFIMETAVRRSRNRLTKFHLGRWEDHLPSLLSANVTLFFDAFPVVRTFSYTAREFQSYLSPLFELLAPEEWSVGFFVAFDKRRIAFRSPSSIKVRRVLSVPLRGPVAGAEVTRASLYSVRRL